ncbi:hypothetical protein SGODD07_01692 [Streptococcus gordonii]|uniref:Uncharacterized protein n=1 Tax=Streptococcus gordonii TaxID=1302 RepID=A0A139N1W6_STRGN|nr:hypothetical protein SGODD07_01692 [Streptococcus gordonii]
MSKKSESKKPALVQLGFLFQLKAIDSLSGNSYNKVASAIKQGQIK